MRRPTLDGTTRDATIVVRLQTRDKEAASEAAEAAGLSLSQWVVEAIRWRLEREGGWRGKWG